MNDLAMRYLGIAIADESDPGQRRSAWWRIVRKEFTTAAQAQAWLSSIPGAYAWIEEEGKGITLGEADYFRFVARAGRLLAEVAEQAATGSEVARDDLSGFTGLPLCREWARLHPFRQAHEWYKYARKSA